MMTALLLLSVLGNNDEELARALARRGWFDLAETASARVPADRRPIVQADILALRMENDVDFESRRRHLDAAIALLTGLQVNEARMNLGWLLARRARVITAEAQLENNTEKQAALLREADQAFLDAEAHYQRLLTLDLPDDLKTEARIELPRTLIDHGGKARLTDALKQLDDLAWNNDLSGYEALLLGGRAADALGDNPGAEQRWRGAFAIVEKLDPKRAPDFPESIAKQAAVALSRLLVRTNRAADAAKVLDQLTKRLPRVAGPDLQLELVDVLVALGNVDGARKILNAIIAADGPFAPRANERLIQLGGNLPPATLMRAADAHMDGERWHAAMIALRKCIETNDKEIVPAAHYKMGLCLAATGRLMEAAAAFEAVDEKYRLAPKACSEAARCYSHLYARSKDARDKEASTRMLDRLIKLYPTSPEADNVFYIKGHEKEAEGKTQEAAAFFVQVPARAEAYEASLVMTAYCFRKLGDADRAEKALRTFLGRLGRKEFEPTEPALIRDRAQFIYLAHVSLAEILRTTKREKEAGALLEAYGETLAADDERLGRLWHVQADIALQQERLNDAMVLVDRIIARFPNSKSSAIASHALANKLYAAIRALMEKGTEKAVVDANLMRIGRYTLKWLNTGTQTGVLTDPAEMTRAADLLYAIAGRLEGNHDQAIAIPGAVGARQAWADAAWAYSLVVDGGAVDARNRAALLAPLARASAFAAQDEPGRRRARERYEAFFKATGLHDAQDKFVAKAATATLLAAYIEYGWVLVSLRPELANSAAESVLGVTGSSFTELYWQAKLLGITAIAERNATDAWNALSMTESNSPGFDGGRYGMKEKFEALKKRVAKILGK